jgi:hypothetical protein
MQTRCIEAVKYQCTQSSGWCVSRSRLEAVSQFLSRISEASAQPSDVPLRIRINYVILPGDDLSEYLMSKNWRRATAVKDVADRPPAWLFSGLKRTQICYLINGHKLSITILYRVHPVLESASTLGGMQMTGQWKLSQNAAVDSSQQLCHLHLFTHLRHSHILFPPYRCIKPF